MMEQSVRENVRTLTEQGRFRYLHARTPKNVKYHTFLYRGDTAGQWVEYRLSAPDLVSFLLNASN